MNFFKNKISLLSVTLFSLSTQFNSNAYKTNYQTFNEYPNAYGITAMSCNSIRKPFIELTLEGFAETYMKVTCYSSGMSVGINKVSFGGKTVFYVNSGSWTQTFPFDINPGVLRRNDEVFLTGINCMNDRNIPMFLTGFNGVSTCG